MSKWAKETLEKIARTGDLHVAPFREDRATPGTATRIWTVVVDGNLYARAYNGERSRWYQAALGRGAGRITATGLILDVTFEPVEGNIQDRIDEAYRVKYHGSSYLDAMVSDRSRAATVRICASFDRK
jgi:hypothetical protein